MHDITYQLYVKRNECYKYNLISFLKFSQAWEVVIIISIFNILLY